MKKLLLLLLCVPLIGLGQGWEKTFGWSNEDYNEIGYSVQQTTDLGFIITGVELYTEDMPPYEDYSDVYLIKTDSSGLEQWSKRFGEEYYNDGGYSVQQTTDGGYIIAGYTESFGNGDDEDVYLIKTDGNGNVTSEFTIPINPNRKLEKVVDILGRDINPEKNKPFIEIYNDGTVEKKMIIE